MVVQNKLEWWLKVADWWLGRPPPTSVGTVVKGLIYFILDRSFVLKTCFSIIVYNVHTLIQGCAQDDLSGGYLLAKVE